MSAIVSPIAVRMRAIRQSLGLTLDQAAAKTGIDAVVLGSWERGDRHPAVERIAYVLTVYGYHLAVVGPDERVVPTTAGGQEQVLYVVAYGSKLDGSIDCDSADEAIAIAAHMPGSRIGYRVVRRSGIEYIDAAELRRSRQSEGGVW